MAQRQPGAVVHVGREDMPRRDYPGLPRPSGQNPGAVEITHPVTEPHLGTRRLCLCQQRTVERALGRTAPQQIEERAFAIHLIRAAGGIENRPGDEGVPLKIRRDSGTGQLVQNIRVAAPVLEPLKIVVKAVPDIRLPLANRHAPSGPRQNNRAGQP